jgi:hypothetical protein
VWLNPEEQKVACWLSNLSMVSSYEGIRIEVHRYKPVGMKIPEGAGHCPFLLNNLTKGTGYGEHAHGKQLRP